ncbi:anosmin-1-like [Hydractinia symbiolongicarpus]|uniref:anosmin-1-like n=1 Tax=Hydractinia symbiolongicarpus TaxID=13093 RepID=UPI00255043F0|nr:anosmin-1-like [Hydractinia symbiolongicarpus]
MVDCWFVFMLAILSVHASFSTPTVNSFVFASARCKARCLTKYLIDSSSRERGKWKWRPLKCTHKDHMCKECQRVCFNQLILTARFDCSQLCESRHVYPFISTCHDSCAFLKNVITAGRKSGSCPAAVNVPKYLMFDLCFHDWECPVDEKCCVTEHKKTVCVPPTFKENRDVPVDLRVDHVDSETCMLTWRMIKRRSSFKRFGIQFVIESRYSMKSYKETYFSFWEPAGQTPKLHRQLKELHAGAWYQFRVAAVSEDGYTGYSEPSQVIKLPLPFERPSRPQNLHINISELDNGKRRTLLTWSLPAKIDGVLQKYRVVYFKTIPSKSFSSVSLNYAINVPADRTFAVLNEVEANTTYQIKVFAVSRAHKLLLRGQRAKLILTTKPLLSKLNLPVGQKSVHIVKRLSNKNTRNLVARLHDLALHNHQAAVTIKWNIPDLTVHAIGITWFNVNCSNAKRTTFVWRRIVPANLKSFRLKYLHLFCQYKIEVLPYFHGNEGEKVVLHIDTGDLVRNETKLSTSTPVEERKFVVVKIPKQLPSLSTAVSTHTWSMIWYWFPLAYLICS